MLKIAHTEIYAHPLPEGHRFPMAKYDLLPQQLIYEGTVNSNNFFKPKEVNEDWILETHDTEYWKKLNSLQLSRKEERRTGFPLSEMLVRRERIINQGTIDCAEYALQYGIAMNIAGGTHHAYSDRGEGFCLLNDIAMASRYLLKKGKANKILVVDLDVHQGNGTAEIFQKEDAVFTFSMHGKNNYPLHKEKSDLDIGLPNGADDSYYLNILKYHLPKLIEGVQPDFIFFQSGVDVLETDKLGKLGMSLKGCKERDRIVLGACKTNNVPVVVSMGGGYSPEIKHIIEAHANTYRLAQDIFF